MRLSKECPSQAVVGSFVNRAGMGYLCLYLYRYYTVLYGTVRELINFAEGSAANL